MGDVDKKIPDTSGLVITTVLNTKISEVQNKIPNTSGLVTTTVLNTKISEVQGLFQALFQVHYTAKILNLELSLENQFFQKKKLCVQINQYIIVYMLKRKLAVFHSLFIFSQI